MKTALHVIYYYCLELNCYTKQHLSLQEVAGKGLLQLSEAKISLPALTNPFRQGCSWKQLHHLLEFSKQMRVACLTCKSQPRRLKTGKVRSKGKQNFMEEDVHSDQKCEVTQCGRPKGVSVTQKLLQKSLFSLYLKNTCLFCSL